MMIVSQAITILYVQKIWVWTNVGVVDPMVAPKLTGVVLGLWLSHITEPVRTGFVIDSNICSCLKEKQYFT